MLDIKYIRENSQIVKEAAKNKLIDVDFLKLMKNFVNLTKKQIK